MVKMLLLTGGFCGLLVMLVWVFFREPDEDDPPMETDTRLYRLRKVATVRQTPRNPNQHTIH